ncbi:MAG: aminopeptidase P family protein [Chloroflexi bacterium]|nr:aminopeptidase P family protein [Chloroflexota bacterium]
MKITDRLQKLRGEMAGREVDAILISQPENRYYLSGFTGSAGCLLITAEKAVLATDFRYVEQVKEQSPEYEIYQIKGDLADWFPEVTSGLSLKKLGIEAGQVTYSMFRQMSDIISKAKLPMKLVPLEGTVEGLRAIKEPEEIELIARAVEISDSAFGHIEGIIRAGMTEKEVAWELEKYLRENGSEKIPFDVIVAAGPNAALPHARPSERRIGEGEPVLMDLGARVEGYASDLSRTIVVGQPDDRFKKVYDTVLGGQLTALAIIQEGMTGEEADRLARTVIEEAGYGDAFGHALGHGVGLAAHEAPRLGPGSTETIKNGMVFSIEPGVYLPGWGGVRIEDLVTMENGKIRVMTRAGKE